MKQIVRFAFFAALVFFPFSRAIAQHNEGHVYTFTVSTVSLTIDSIKTMDQLNLVKSLITGNSEVRDFDIKGRKCNFTLDNSGDKLNVILKNLRNAGFKVAVVRNEASQTFTHVPTEACDQNNKKDQMSEEEVMEYRKTHPEAIGR